MSKLSTDPIPGTRDFFPEEMSVRQQVFARLYQVVESHGYLRYDGPMLEPLELYAAKSSEEIVAGQTYHMTDRGGRELVVRPEMTPTVARMIAARSGGLQLPARWYSHPNLWRYERKQRGRYREHWQVNVDLFGTESHEAEAEIFTILAEMMFALGAKTGDFVLRVSDRSLVYAALERHARVRSEHLAQVAGALDGLAKVGEEATREALLEIGCAAEFLDPIFEVLRATPDELGKLVPAEVAERSNVLRVMREGFSTSCPVNLRFDPTIVRGFTYYTSSVFEIYDTDPQNPRSIAGGGRYDNLVALFGAARVPGIGFGMGDVTLIDFLETHGIAPKARLAPDAIVLSPGQEPGDRRRVREIAGELRRAGLRVTIPLDPGKLGKQLARAAREGTRFVVIAGSVEARRGAVKLRDLGRSVEEEVALAGLVERIRFVLNAG